MRRSQDPNGLFRYANGATADRGLGDAIRTYSLPRVWLKREARQPTLHNPLRDRNMRRSSMSELGSFAAEPFSPYAADRCPLCPESGHEIRILATVLARLQRVDGVAGHARRRKREGGARKMKNPPANYSGRVWISRDAKCQRPLMASRLAPRFQPKCIAGALSSQVSNPKIEALYFKAGDRSR